jgi:hypothetical protein
VKSCARRLATGLNCDGKGAGYQLSSPYQGPVLYADGAPGNRSNMFHVWLLGQKVAVFGRMGLRDRREELVFYALCLRPRP